MHTLNDFSDMMQYFNDFASKEMAQGSDTLYELVDEILQYDVYDFIARLSALNLLIENQNKSTLFDPLIEALLFNYERFPDDADVMTSLKFSNVITRLENSEFCVLIDPPENPFIERIRYHGNYWIFPGINYHPAFCLQGFLNILFLKSNTFSDKFISSARYLTNFILSISNRAASMLGYDQNTIEHVETSRIRLPSQKNQDILKECVYIKYDTVERLVPDAALRTRLFYDPARIQIPEEADINNQMFFRYPFLRTKNNHVIILNPAILTSFLVHQFILLAEEFNCKKDLIIAYNREVLSQCTYCLDSLGHHKIDCSAYGINLLESDIRKELLYTVGNAKILVCHYICDMGEDYHESSMFAPYTINDSLDSIAARSAYFISKLPYLVSDNIYNLIIINSFGRFISYVATKGVDDKIIILTPSDLVCIAINEKNHDNFLAQYMDAKYKIPGLFQSPISQELDTVDMYVQNNYSFYFSDDLSMSKMNVIFGLGDSLDYIIKALKAQDRHLIDSYDGIHLRDVSLFDQDRKIYSPRINPNHGLELVVEFNEIAIWITTPASQNIDEFNIYFTIVDLLSYWIGECRPCFIGSYFNTSAIRIEIILTEKSGAYYIADSNSDTEPDQPDQIKYLKESNQITMYWTPQIYHSLQNHINTAEKYIVTSLLDQIFTYSSENYSSVIIDDIFKNPLKKKVFTADVSKSPLLRPTNNKMVLISPESIDQLLNEIGAHFLAMPEYSIGKVPDSKREALANGIVGYLYTLLQNEVATFKPDGILEYIYNDLETVMYEAMISQARYVYDVACYPKSAESIMDQQNKINESSVALKFLIEYIVSTPPSGTRPFDILQYDRLLSICSLIITWAYQNDLFHYHRINTPIEFLKSGRVGMKQDENDFLNSINLTARKRKLNELSNPFISTFSPVESIQELNSRIDEAFLDEYGFSFTEFTACIENIEAYGDLLSGEVKKCSEAELIQYFNQNQTLSESTLKNIIAQISIAPRDDFLVPPKPFKREDVYPWRFNRELSFTRRPVIKSGDNIIWGNRQLHHMWRYTIDLIISGKYKARRPKLRTLIGTLSNKRGNEFNTSVAQKLRSISGIQVDERVSKINGKKIAGPDKNVLGDIDVLYIVPQKKKIVVGEVKDFSFAKGPYEMEQEYRKIFVDGEKPCFLTKHHKRVEWVRKHVDDVIAQYHLEPGAWSVRSAMFVSDDIISKDFFHIKEKIIVFTDISDKAVKSV